MYIYCWGAIYKTDHAFQFSSLLILICLRNTRDRYLGNETFSPCILSSSSSRWIFPAQPLKTRGTTGDTVVARGWSRRSILMGIRGSSARKSDILPRRIAFNCCWVSVTVARTLFRLFLFLLLFLSSCFLQLERKKTIVPRNYKWFQLFSRIIWVIG